MKTIWWLSFADGKCLGMCFIEAEDIIDAATKAWELGINPGGEVLGFDMGLTAETIEEAAKFEMNRLYSPEEMRAKGYSTMRETIARQN